METNKYTENTPNCTVCGANSKYNLIKWPPKEDKKNNTLIIEYICENDHEFVIKKILKHK